MRGIWRRLLLMFTALGLGTAHAAVPVVVPDDVLADYLQLANGRHPAEIQQFSGPGARRDSVELLLMQKALLLGGFHEALQFRIANSYRRSVNLLTTGGAAIYGNSMWQADLQPYLEHVLISEPILRDGEFEAGLYVSPERVEQFKLRSAADLRALSAACDPTWSSDWNTLQSLQLRDLRATTEWPNMVRMVLQQRVDFVLAPFQPSADLGFATPQGRLVPVPGVKLLLQGTRHFAVSRHHPQAERILKALNDGLSRLRREGVLLRAYSEAGFFNSQAKNWRVLNGTPPSSPAPKAIEPVRD